MKLIPQFDSSADFVWAAYGLALVLIGGAIAYTILRIRTAKRRLERLEKSTDKE